MIVVSNTSPLNYLIQIEKIELLLALFEVVVAPSAVHAELLRIESLDRVRAWIAAPSA